MARQDLNLTASEISTHNSRSSCWVVIKGKVYDVTDFLDEHPGGAKVILLYAGRDATEAFEPIHPEGTLDELPREKHLGDVVDPQNVQQPAKEEPKRNGKLKEVGGEVVEEVEQQLGLHECINLHDFERAARTGLPRKAWTYYSSGATDEITLRLNSSIFSRILFRPRVLNDVSVVATSTSILGHETSLPFFVSPAAMGRLAHFDGEKCLARGAGEFGIAYMVSSNASLSAEEIISSSRSPRQPFFFQLYVNTDRPKSEAIISRIEKAGYKAIVLTVDSAVAGKRELDEREKADVVVASDTSGSAAIPQDSKGAGIGRAIGAYIDPSLSWKDLDWLRSRTKLPIIVKGIQHVEDAKKAIEWGVDAIYLSNHGGRSVDTSPPAIMILLELRRDLPHLFGPQPHGVRSKKVPEIYIDGGVRRGTDIVKALCLGAKAVGIGRSFMYSLLFGDDGVKSVCQVLKDEIETTMRLIGVTRLEDLGPHLVNTKAIDGMMGDPEPATVGGFSWWKRARL